MDKTVIVYTMDDCVECSVVKQLLTAAGIPFEARNITKNEEYKQEVETYGFMGVPVTVVGERAVKGFNPELIELIQLRKQ